jgi:hypothetical protein
VIIYSKSRSVYFIPTKVLEINQVENFLAQEPESESLGYYSSTSWVFKA